MPSELRSANTPQSNTDSQVNTETQGERGGPNADIKLNEIMPISSYEGETGHSFALDYFKLDTQPEFLDTPIRQDLELIDGFVKDYIKSESKEDTILSYSKTLKALEKKIGIDDNTFRTESIQKLSKLIKNYNMVKDAYSKNINRKILNKLIKMSQEGHNTYDQQEYLLEMMGGLV